MRKRAAALVAVAASTPATAAGKHRVHVPGCLSRSCDNHIGAIWRAHHPKARTAIASYYGPGLYGHKTACGQTLTPTTFGVAHKLLACGTRVRLCVKRCVVASVIDRGPYVPGREWDLTAPVRDAIGAGSLGTVRFTVVG